MKLRVCAAFLLSSLLIPTAAFGHSRRSPTASGNADLRSGLHSLDVASVWSGHPVGFALLTRGNQQFVAFYDAERRMTLAQRTLGEHRWSLTVLPSTLGWDSHNYVTMAMDREGYLHVAGNMHASPLVYFRSARPYDASSMERVSALTGKN